MPTRVHTAPTRYLFYSHDGFGLGHFRRNSLIATAVLERDPTASVVLVTGLAVPPGWARSPRLGVVRVPPLVKDSEGGYRATSMTFEDALGRRAVTFAAVTALYRPHVIVVDRHPYGTAGELRPGLVAAREAGARLVLGLRDILDEPEVIACELAGKGWEGVADLYDEAFVYGAPHVCDHQAEYGLALTPQYCGWVVARPSAVTPSDRLLAVAAGGGGDGAAVFELGIRAVERREGWWGHMAAGPYADARALRRLARRSPARRRLHVDTAVEDCGQLFAGAAAVVQMAGYNSTVEALAAGHRPILVPRRAPRREQAIRAERLADLDLCDVVPEQADAAAVAGLLDGRRRLGPDDLRRAGIDLGGAANAAGLLGRLAVGVAA